MDVRCSNHVRLSSGCSGVTTACVRNSRDRGSRSLYFKKNVRTVLTNVINDVGGAALQQALADDGKRGVHDEGAVVGVGVMLLQDDGG